MSRYISPGKLNLFFRVLKKRRDGYHDIASLYAAVDLFDEIFIDLSNKDRFSTNHKSLQIEENNLVNKALKAFRSKAGIFDKLTIHLEKNIPIGAGLGGGSSNAATTLWALNELFDKPLSIEDLALLGAQIGADIPFFFSCGTAYCTGVGEIFENSQFSEEFSLLWLALPENIEASTPLVYGRCVPSEVSSKEPRDLLEGLKNGDDEAFVNDLEPAAFRVVPALEKVKNRLLDLGFRKVCMTGSGSAFFCIGDFDNRKVKGINFQKVRTLSRVNSEWYLHNIHKRSILKGKTVRVCEQK